MAYKTLIQIFGSADKTVLKPKTKNTTDNLKELHYEVNRVLYNFKYINISPTAAKWLMSYLTNTAQKMKELEIGLDAAKRKREELMEIMRELAICLKRYSDEEDDDREQNAKVINYLFGKQLRDKKTGKFADAEEVLKQLKANKLYERLYPTDKENICKFREWQEELIEIMVSKYRF